MSYELRVENVTPSAHLLRDVGAQYRPIRHPGVTAWLAWRGRPARGVTLTAYQGHALVKLRGFSSPDDLALAVELISRLARAKGQPVWVEDVPPGAVYDRDTAPTSPLSASLFAFSPDEIQRWPTGWFEYQTAASHTGLRGDVTARSAAALSTPGRDAMLSRALLQTLGATGFPAPRFLGFGKQRRPLSLPFVATSATPIEDYLQWAHPLLMLAVRPRFIEPGLPITEARSGPPPANLVEEPPFLGADYSVVEEGAPRSAFVPLVPGQRQLVCRASYVAMQRGLSWALVPLKGFLSVAAPSLVAVDEHTWAFEAPAGREWQQLWAPLLSRAIREVPHQHQYLEDAGDLRVQYHPEHLQGAPENELINALLEAKALGRFDQALSAAVELCVVAPDRSDGHYWSSRVLLAMGEPRAALAELRLAVQLRHALPEFRAGMLGDLAEQLFNAGELAEARQAIARALAVAPPDSPSRAEAVAFQARLAAPPGPGAGEPTP